MPINMPQMRLWARYENVCPELTPEQAYTNKILYKFHGLPMIEHVRRRALLSEHINEVYVATCDEKIAKTIMKYGGQVILTSKLMVQVKLYQEQLLIIQTLIFTNFQVF